MALIVETGSGVQGAESYASVAFIDTYWAARTHDANAAAWAALTTAQKEGSAREATSYLDSVYGSYYKGIRRGYVQGLLWPRDKALDEAGYPLPDLPDDLKRATAELAVRASSSRLSPDAARDNLVKRIKKKVGPLETETEYADGASTQTRYGSVEGFLAGLLAVPGGAGSGSWFWA